MLLTPEVNARALHFISKKVRTIHLVVGIARQYRYSDGLLCLSKYSIAMYIWKVISGITIRRELFFED